MWRTGLVAPWYVVSSQTRTRTCVPCIGRRILNHCATREVPTTTHLLEFPKSETRATPNPGKDVEQMNSHSLPVGMQDGAPTLEDSLALSYETKHTLKIPSSNLAPWYLPKEVEILVHTKTCTWTFIAVFFIIAKIWRQPRCLSVGEWINNPWYIQTMK